jgi:hypothetical protein
MSCPRAFAGSVTMASSMARPGSWIAPPNAKPELRPPRNYRKCGHPSWASARGFYCAVSC